MSHGPIKVDWIKWNEQTMTVRGAVYYLPDEPVVTTIAYRHVTGMQSFVDDGLRYLAFEAGPERFSMMFQDDANGRDAAAELARRMEACR